MKIVQNINLYPQAKGSNSDTYEEMPARFYFDPSLYSGVQAIYFEVCSERPTTGIAGTIQLFNVDTGVTISELIISATSWTRTRSADLKDVLTSAVTLGYRVKRNSGSGWQFTYWFSPSLFIEQDDSLASRKTAAYLPMGNYAQDSGTAWQYQDGCKGKPQFGSAYADGAKSVYFECWLRQVSGGTAEVRLYDITAGAVVTGSLMTTDSNIYTRLVSPALSLDDTHVYRVEDRSNMALESAEITGAHLKFVNSGFNKTVFFPIAFPNVNCSYAEVWNQTGPSYLLERSKFDADSFKIFCGAYGYSMWDPIDGDFDWYDADAAAEIDGTFKHYETVAEVPIDVFEEEVPVLNAGDHTIYLRGINRYFANTFFYQGPGALYVYKNEPLPAGPSLQADPTQPSGYHCFMSQFFKNCYAALVPLKTPDGVNKCW